MWVIMQVLSNPTTILKKSQTYTLYFSIFQLFYQLLNIHFNQHAQSAGVANLTSSTHNTNYEMSNFTARAFEARVKALSFGRYKAVCCLLSIFGFAPCLKESECNGWRVTFDRRNMFCLGKQSITMMSTTTVFSRLLENSYSIYSLFYKIWIY